MILIGSQALNYYKKLDRKLHDWDLLGTPDEIDKFNKTWGKYLVKSTDYSFIYDINGKIVEVRNPATLDETDHILIKYSLGNPHMDTFFGRVYIPSIQFLHDLKRATAEYIKEPKHYYDLTFIIQNWGPGTSGNLDLDSEFYRKRLQETKFRIEKSGKKLYDFFHKYHIPEYILHDRLHDMIADLLDLNIPTYKRITVAETDIAEDLFNKLTHEQKVNLMMEESLVLNLERWFIPQMIENGINYKLIDHFYNNNEAMPTYLILKHVNLKGLKGEKEYIVNFGKNNFFEIEKAWIEAKEKIKAKGGFPSWFFQELFDLRDKYKKGEKIGFHLVKENQM